MLTSYIFYVVHVVFLLFRLALVGCISGLTIRFRDPSSNVAVPRRRTLTGWRSSGLDSAGQRRRLIRLNNIWSQYRFPSHGSWPYSGKSGKTPQIFMRKKIEMNTLRPKPMTMFFKNCFLFKWWSS